MSHLSRVEYHSREWDHLVESGWVTAYVDALPDGTRIATMLWQPPRYWR